MSSGVVKLSQQIDERLLQFFLDEANAGREVNNLQLEEKALDIARELKLDTFTLVSGQYIECWRQQHGTTTFSDTNEDHKEPVEMQEATQASRASIQALSRRHMYRLDAVLAMDEVMVSITSPTADENDGTAGKNSCATIGITGSGSEIGFTVALAACASGVKLPAFLILKEESGHIQEQALRELRVPERLPRLNPAAERRLSPRIPFVQIRRLMNWTNGQFGIKGPIVNVPVDTDLMLKQLPRDVHNQQQIMVNIKRRRFDKGVYLADEVSRQQLLPWIEVTPYQMPLH
ncbi:hypothetical protein V5799_006440 [Amblyomma americanum]|uniref:DUF6570 domain-containing protein n=1 Tax=Amblyomma americanum TaxID=6943 RepID=A0AAQ4DWE6_AMBAM